MKKYNLVNNTLGWLTFVVAAVTYLLTIEPTASFWDCPEFISQGYKLEIGHPPGNPVFILAARFAANFAGGDVTLVSKCVNAMSALLSAATILLLFWSITHLVKKLVVKDGEEDTMTLAQYLVIMGSGLCGALVYTWSDTFWYSAVEAEVYAFSSFCTALVFWLILKWENRAASPSSDRYLILIAYIFGVSLGVHLLNLLAIPAIALIFYYRNWRETNVKGSLLALLVSFAVIVLILYGLEPGFVELAGYFELLMVNGMGMGFGMGALCYAILLMAVLAWTLWELHKGSATRARVAFLLSVALSGMLFIGDKLWVPVLLLAALAAVLFVWMKNVPTRLLANVTLGIMMIFIGFSSYALVLIRADANTPLDENAPNSPFALSSYLSRDQYGRSPLLYGETVFSPAMHHLDGSFVYTEGPEQYTREVKTADGQNDRYHDMGPRQDIVYAPEANMLFPRIHNSMYADEYRSILGDGSLEETVDATVYVDDDGTPAQSSPVPKPTFKENLQYFFGYQLNYMYWRYFMWNFVGRQNDLQGTGGGDIMAGNWISGIAPLDNARLGNQSLLPDEYGSQNKGHNVFFFLPLLLGIIGLLWQAFKDKKGIEQFWVVFFLFFMTGLAIVLYLNQTPSQPRERDYAYAGSFYAFAIWVGMGVAGLWQMLSKALARDNSEKKSLAMAVVAAAVGILVPLQMVSQTWDDHDRSGRYCARDFGMNYLSSLDENAIIFCNGDNDTFPLWYAQEVEGYRTDVRAVNLSYLSTDWYIHQMRTAAYDSRPLPMMADDNTYAYSKRERAFVIDPDTLPRNATDALKYYYDDKNLINPEYNEPEWKFTRVFINIDPDKAIAAGVVDSLDRDRIEEMLPVTLSNSAVSASTIMSLDLVNASIAGGWKRPVYFAMTVPDSYYLGLGAYMRNTGMAYQVTPVRYDGYNDRSRQIGCNTDKMFDIVTTKFRWGGLDTAKPGAIYLDETVNRMVNSTRMSIISLAADLCTEGALAQRAKEAGMGEFRGRKVDEYIADRYKKALTVLQLMEKKLPAASSPYSGDFGMEVARVYGDIADATGNEQARRHARELAQDAVVKYAKYVRFYTHLRDRGMDYLMSSRDNAIEQQLVYSLLLDYYELSPDTYGDLMKKLKALGIDEYHMSDYRDFPQRYIESLQQQEEPMAQPQQQAAAVEVADTTAQ